MKKLFLFIVLNVGLLTLNGFAQKRSIDSLLSLLKTDKPDTNKVKHLNALSRRLMNQNPDTAIILCNEALDILAPIHSREFVFSNEEINNPRLLILQGNALDNLANSCLSKDDYTGALENCLKLLKIDQALKKKKRIASSFCLIGLAYMNLGDYNKALDYSFNALKMYEEQKNKDGIAAVLINIGIIYFQQEDLNKALDYYLKGAEIAKEIGNKQWENNALGNIGNIYTAQGNYSKALDSYYMVLKLSKELKNKNSVARSLQNIGNVLCKKKDYTKGVDCFLKGRELADETGDKNLVADNLRSLGEAYISTGKFRYAEQSLKRAISIEDSIGAIDDIRNSEIVLSQLYDTIAQLALTKKQYAIASENYKLCMFHYKKAIILKDTLFSQENKKQLVRKEMTYEFNKKEAATKAENDKHQAVAAAESKKQKIIIWSVLAGLLLVIVFAGFVFRSLRITRKQKNIIEQQKNEVFQQKEIVEKQKEKITDSITYAQRIQQSILMEESEIQNYLPESFIYFQPKDIVSGDFYWCSKIDDKIIIAAVDCTGHGVPGAFMSMIGNTLLNQIVNEKRITTPSEILKHLNLAVYEALHQQKDGVLSVDGMAIALCMIDYERNEIQYAGAENPLYMLSNGEIEIIKANVYGIGGGGMLAKLHDPLKREFTNHVIAIKESMSIYLFTDGYMDQFGGLERKKLGTQKFKELLLNNEHISMQKQKEQLASAHTAWRGNSPQIDDVLVIGIKI